MLNLGLRKKGGDACVSICYRVYVAWHRIIVIVMHVMGNIGWWFPYFNWKPKSCNLTCLLASSYVKMCFLCKIWKTQISWNIGYLIRFSRVWIYLDEFCDLDSLELLLVPSIVVFHTSLSFKNKSHLYNAKSSTSLLVEIPIPLRILFSCVPLGKRRPLPPSLHLTPMYFLSCFPPLLKSWSTHFWVVNSMIDSRSSHQTLCFIGMI